MNANESNPAKAPTPALIQQLVKAAVKSGRTVARKGATSPTHWVILNLGRPTDIWFQGSSRAECEAQLAEYLADQIVGAFSLSIEARYGSPIIGDDGNED